MTRLLHYQKAEVWVECIERPILRKKGEKEALTARIEQAPAPEAIIGGNHAVANLLYPLYESQCEAVRAVSILTDERTTALAAVGMRQKSPGIVAEA